MSNKRNKKKFLQPELVPIPQKQNGQEKAQRKFFNRTTLK